MKTKEECLYLQQGGTSRCYARVQYGRAYNDPDDETVRVYTHAMLALAYVPEAEVGRLFQLLSDDAPDCMTPLFKYFDRYYVTGVPARGRRRAVQPRYPPAIWNQYEAVVANSHKMNNVSEGWHNCFCIIIAKHLSLIHI